MRTCDKALAQFPDMLLRIGSAALGGGSRGGASAQTGDLEPLSAAELYSWQHQRAHLMFEVGLPFSTVDSEKCRVFFCRISGSHFDGPGDRRRVGGPLLDLSSLDVGGRVAEKLRENDSVCLMVDGAADVCEWQSCLQYYDLWSLPVLAFYRSRGYQNCFFCQPP